MTIVPQLSLDFTLSLKTCTRCLLSKETTLYRIKIKATGRLCAWCKECEKAYQSEHKAANPEAYKEMCRKSAQKCKESHPARATQNMRRWRERNPERAKEIQLRSDAKRRGNRGAYLAATKKHRQHKNAEYRQQNQASIKAYNKQYYINNLEAVAASVAKSRQSKLEHYQEMARKWKRDNPDKRQAMCHNRRARLHGNGGKHTAKEWRDLKAKYDFRCLMCQKQEPEVNLAADHVIPVSKGGRNDISNLQPLCKSCNSIKHRKILDLR